MQTAFANDEVADSLRDGQGLRDGREIGLAETMSSLVKVFLLSSCDLSLSSP